MKQVHKAVRSALLATIAALALTGGPAAAETPAGDIRIADTRVFPESVTVDSRGRIYAGSFKGTIYRSLPGSGVAEPWITPTAGNGILAILGVFADDRTGTLWACSIPATITDPPKTGRSELMAFDLETGEQKGRYPLPDPDPAACNDIAIDAGGTVFATDTPNGRILTLAPGAEALEVLAADDALRGIDGLAFDGDGTLYINNVQKNLLQRVDRAADGSYAGLTTLTTSLPLSGPDGLRSLGGNRFLQAEGPIGRITEVTIEGDSARIQALKEGLDGSAGVTPAGAVAYATEGKIGYLVDPKLKGQDPGEFHLRAVPLEAQ